MPFRLADDRLVCESPTLEARFEIGTGSLVSLVNRATGQQLVAPSDAPPWRLMAQGSMPSAYPAPTATMGFQYVETHPVAVEVDIARDSATLRWSTTESSIGVEVRFTFNPHGGLEMWPRVVVGTGTPPPAHFVFPTFTPAGLSDDDRLLFPAHSGWLISDPLETVTKAVYPDGYHGLSVQVMAYFAEGSGGFYIACHDPFVTHKEFSFGSTGASIRHDTWDLRSGTSIELDYPVVIDALGAGGWFEAAERYREWALTAPWSGGGLNLERTGIDRPRWLFEEVGLSVWGTPSSLDWSERYRVLGDLAGTPLHIVSGWDWPATRPHYVGKEGWFPAKFHPANLDAWRDHYVTPYMNDLFISAHAPDFHQTWEPHVIFPYKTFTFTVFSERSPQFVQGLGSPGDVAVMTDIDFYMCPATGAQRDLHTWRDERLVGDHNLDGIFYDISSGNPGMARCLRTDHGHTPGWSRDVLVAYADNNAASRAAVRDATGKVPAQGVETIVEHVIHDIDFYVTRSAAGPLGGLEAFTLGPESPPGGGRELVPLFQAVYHDIGPVHEDGWLTFERTFGDIFYWITARIVAVWGGILSLHYANNPPERFEGLETGEVISWDGGHHVFEELEPVDQGFIDFAAAMGSFRTGVANPYVAYGRMLAPLAFDVPDVTLRFHRGNAVLTGIVRDGSWDVPCVVSGAWEAADGRIGVVLVNVAAEPVLLSTRIQTRWDVKDARGTLIGAEGEAALVDGFLDLEVLLPSRQPVLIELTP